MPIYKKGNMWADSSAQTVLFTSNSTIRGDGCLVMMLIVIRQAERTDRELCGGVETNSDSQLRTRVRGELSGDREWEAGEGGGAAARREVAEQRGGLGAVMKRTFRVYYIECWRYSFRMEVATAIVIRYIDDALQDLRQNGFVDPRNETIWICPGAMLKIEEITE